ncbi:MAG: sigma-54-dependent Fis family transcriptional regulator [Deltaproteobacteria bacterium]|nr:sigma-54-dependent Fis family transcriptional regulator [Deltaproteobacteria bacterium]
MLFKETCDVALTESVDAALESLDRAPADAVLLDLVMPGRSGFDFLREVSQRPNPPPVVVVTATSSVSSAVEAMRLGAVDYVTKPFEIDALRRRVRSLLERRALEAEVERLRDQIEGRSRLGRLIGQSPRMQEIFRTVERVAPSRATVLILGESGTGKELVARALHELGRRRDGPFVPVNCAAIPDSLIENELFGHERGAYTDARDRKVGRFEAATGGTLFLDEVGELSPGVQAKLLRALQERTIERVGSHEPIPIDVRVVAATNRNLERDVAAGRFREDLYYRINVVPVRMPPLRERREDIRLLAQSYLERAHAEGHRGPARITATALAALERYAFPGNVRELENALERAMALAEGEAIELEDLPEVVVRAERTEGLRDDLRGGRISLAEAVSRFESELIREALERCGWNQTRAAEQLGLTRRLLKLKMDRFGLGH